MNNLLVNCYFLFLIFIINTVHVQCYYTYTVHAYNILNVYFHTTLHLIYSTCLPVPFISHTYMMCVLDRIRWWLQTKVFALHKNCP